MSWYACFLNGPTSGGTVNAGNDASEALRFARLDARLKEDVRTCEALPISGESLESLLDWINEQVFESPEDGDIRDVGDPEAIHQLLTKSGVSGVAAYDQYASILASNVEEPESEDPSDDSSLSGED